MFGKLGFGSCAGFRCGFAVEQIGCVVGACKFRRGVRCAFRRYAGNVVEFVVLKVVYLHEYVAVGERVEIAVPVQCPCKQRKSVVAYGGGVYNSRKNRTAVNSCIEKTLTVPVVFVLLNCSLYYLVDFFVGIALAFASGFCSVFYA